MWTARTPLECDRDRSVMNVDCIERSEIFDFFSTVCRRATAKGGVSPSRSALWPRSAKMKDAAMVNEREGRPVAAFWKRPC